MKIKITPGLILLILILAIAMLLLLTYLFAGFLKSLNTDGALVVFGAIMISALVIDRFDKRRTEKENTGFIIIAKLVLGVYDEEFLKFYNLYSRHKKAFSTQYAALLKEHDNLDFKNLRPIDIAYLFANSKRLVYMTDWKGEENNREIESFLETLVQTPTWENTSAFRMRLNNDHLDDAQFTVDLLKSIDKDLKAVGYRLIFFDLGWDAYVYTCLSVKIYNEVISKTPTPFHGVRKLG